MTFLSLIVLIKFSSVILNLFWSSFVLINIPVTLIKSPIHSTPCLNQFGKYKFSLVILGLYQMGMTLTDCYSKFCYCHIDLPMLGERLSKNHL